MQNKANILFETAIIGNLSLTPMAGFKNNAPPIPPSRYGNKYAKQTQFTSHEPPATNEDKKCKTNPI